MQTRSDKARSAAGPSAAALENTSSAQPGTRVPQVAANRLAPAQPWIGRMPGMIGASMPAAAHLSRNRKNVSASKKNCVIALVAPASILRFSQATSASVPLLSGWGSG